MTRAEFDFFKWAKFEWNEKILKDKKLVWRINCFWVWLTTRLLFSLERQNITSLSFSSSSSYISSQMCANVSLNLFIDSLLLTSTHFYSLSLSLSLSLALFFCHIHLITQRHLLFSTFLKMSNLLLFIFCTLLCLVFISFTDNLYN